GKKEEAHKIALLHAKSWKSAYRGIMSDDYLNYEVVEERLYYWHYRFAKTNADEFIFVAENADLFQGFICVRGNDDPVWGCLIDNLHVLPEMKGNGIGKKLFEAGVEWIKSRYDAAHFYLWVYEANNSACGFYDNLGGECVEKVQLQDPDGRFLPILRYVWR
ncbi:MAG: GNAT family N-acetyltransferase, partial [Saprospiraceae bacterium]|nr:GNAT family N-acetyltransferase [Saprospiraceae bacterium]